MMGIYFFFINRNALNQPSFDDYDATLQTLKLWLEAPGFPQKIKVLLLPHNEHFIALSRGLSIGYYQLFGNINFRHLILLQQLFLVGSYALTLAWLCRIGAGPEQALLPVTLLYFSFSLWQAGGYYWAGIQHFSVIFFMQASLLLLHRARRYTDPSFWAAWAAAAAALLSFGNGVLALPLGGLLLVLQQKKQLLWGWGGLFILFVGLKKAFAISHRLALPEGPAALKTFVAFLGNAFFLNPDNRPLFYLNVALCLGLGVAFLLALFYLALKRLPQQQPLAYTWLLLPFLNAGLVAFSRYEGKISAGLAPRYAFFATALPVALLGIGLARGWVSGRKLQLLTAGLALWWGLNLMVQTTHMQYFNSDLTGRLRQLQQQPATRLVYYSASPHFGQLLGWALQNGVWQPPPATPAHAPVPR